MSDAFDIVTFRGKRVDKKTRAFLMAMEAKLGYELTVVQGSYNAGGVAASGGTHDRGGVVDLAAYDWANKVKVAADLGAFVWMRPYVPGLWGQHVHLGIRDHGNLHATAARQQQDWDSRPPRNGLASHAPMTSGYHPGEKIRFLYPVPPPPPPPKNNVTKARDEVVEAIHNLAQAAAFLDDADPNRTKAKKQIDDLKVQHKRLRAILAEMPKT